MINVVPISEVVIALSFSILPIGPRFLFQVLRAKRAKLARMLGIIVMALGLLGAGPPQASPAGSVVPMQIVNNHVVVNVTLDGAGPFRFIVDSGSGNLVDPAVARAIGAHVGGQVQLFGVGAGTESGAVTRVHRVRIGAATFTDQRFVVAPAHATFAAAEGPAIDGLIGRSIIGSGVTVFDYAARTLTFDAGDAAVGAGGATVLPITTISGEPHVPCTISGVAGSCAIDTGSRLNVTVLANFAKQFTSIVPLTLSAIGVDGYGIGGAAYGRLGRLESLTFGPLALTGILADFSVQQHGAFASTRTSANVGGGVLRRFTLAFDLAHRRIGMRADAGFAAPYAVDRSGLFLITREDAVAVLDVRPQTPADRAGILAGDRILRAQGRPLPPQALPRLRALLEGPADTHVELTIARGGEAPRTVDLRLGDVL
jgi:hypothetical protein